jgi:hypothetical protein
LFRLLAIVDRGHCGERIVCTRGLGVRRRLLYRVTLHRLQRCAVVPGATEFEAAADSRSRSVLANVSDRFRKVSSADWAPQRAIGERGP